MKNLVYSLAMCIFMVLSANVRLNSQTLSQSYTAGYRYYDLNSQQNLDLVNVVFNKNYTSSKEQNPGHITDEFMASREKGTGTHKGVDYRAKSPGHNLYSPLSGVVSSVDPNGQNYGKICIYNSTYDLTFIFLHCSESYVTQGQQIAIGQYVGKSGNTSPDNIEYHFHAELRSGRQTSATKTVGDVTGNYYDPRIIMNYFPACDATGTTIKIMSDIFVSTNPNSCTNSLQPGENKYIRFTLKNITDCPITRAFKLYLTDLSNNEKATIWSEEITFNPNQAVIRDWNTHPNGLGGIVHDHIPGNYKVVLKGGKGALSDITMSSSTVACQTSGCNPANIQILEGDGGHGTADYYYITTSSSPSNGGTTSGDGEYPAGATRTVTATANSGYTFNNWTENGEQKSSNASYSFTLSANRNLVANFTATGGGGNGCTTGDLYPEATFTPSCTGSNETIEANCYAGEYSKVSVTNGTSYTFSSSVSSDFITIANSTGATVLTTGTGSVTWTAPSSTTIRFYTHTNSNCGTANTNRSRRVKCNSSVPPPANDNCSNAISLSYGTQQTGTLTCATPTANISYSQSTKNDVFYYFTTANAGDYTITLNDYSDDKDLFLYSSCSSATALESSTNSGSEETITYSCTAGTTYHIRVTDYDGTGGTFSIRVDCSVQTGYCATIPDYDYHITPTTSWKTDPWEVQQDGCKMYRFSATQGTKYTFKTGCGDGANTDFDTQLYLYNSSGDELTNNDDGCGYSGGDIIENYEINYSGYAYLKVKGLNQYQSGNYTLAYKKEIVLSDDANLSSLSVNQGILTPSFNSNTLNYTVSVANSASAIVISATANHANATINGAGTKSLNVGQNTFNVIVTAENETTQKTYTVVVIRENPPLSNDANLSSLSVDQGTLMPNFNSNTLNYTVSVANSASAIVISAIANHANATINGAGTKSLNVGQNTFNVIVTAENETTQKTYTVVVIRENPILSNDATLKEINLSQGTLHNDCEENRYLVFVPNIIQNITINGIANNEKATINGNGNKSLDIGDNVFILEVFAEDGTLNTYTVIVNRADVPVGNRMEDSEVYWRMENNVLIIDGLGNMPDYSAYFDVPWYWDYRNEIKHVIIKNGVTSIGTKTFYNYPNMQTIEFPLTINRIGGGSFLNLPSLTELIFPFNISSIGYGAFSMCNILKVTVKWEQPLFIYDETFYLNNTPLTSAILQVPIGTKTIYENAQGWKNFGTIQEIAIDLCDNSNGSTPNAIKNIENVKITIFPNPTENDIFIRSELPVEKVEIYSLTGALLILENNFAEKISVSTLPQGVYLLKVYTDKGMAVSKIVKE